ncbi:MAG TPA: GTPase HflX, partial [Saprospiraceae bacterium]|nr:GTPase HflX [Saprospiraceae bacterium]
HPQYEDQITTVNATLKELKADLKPTLMVFNKIDAYKEKNFDEYLDSQTKQEILSELSNHLKNTFEHDNVFISAHTKENFELLKEKMAELITIEYQIRYPYKTKTW